MSRSRAGDYGIRFLCQAALEDAGALQHEGSRSSLQSSADPLRPTNDAEPSAAYIIRYSTRPSPSMSPVKVLATLARVSLGRSGPSLYGFSSQLLMAKRTFTVFTSPPLSLTTAVGAARCRTGGPALMLNYIEPCLTHDSEGASRLIPVEKHANHFL